MAGGHGRPFLIYERCQMEFMLVGGLCGLFATWIVRALQPRPTPWAKCQNGERIDSSHVCCNCRNLEDCEDDCRPVVY